jgi:hypothetical protein
VYIKSEIFWVLVRFVVNQNILKMEFDFAKAIFHNNLPGAFNINEVSLSLISEIILSHNF